jgi:hypothetical protein
MSKQIAMIFLIEQTRYTVQTNINDRNLVLVFLVSKGVLQCLAIGCWDLSSRVILSSPIPETNIMIFVRLYGLYLTTMAFKNIKYR